jgi:hypothetical protein
MGGSGEREGTIRPPLFEDVTALSVDLSMIVTE